MKKLLMTVAVLGCVATMVSAQTVTSANIVGYSKKAMPLNSIDIVSPQFLAGDAGGISLDDAFGGMSDSTSIYAWDGGAYSLYTYYEGYGWFDPSFVAAGGVLIGQGDGVWLQSGTVAADVIMSGEVSLAGSITNTLIVGINMVANPYPVSMRLSEIPEVSLSDGDVVYLWSGSYSVYTFYVGYGWFDPSFVAADDVQVGVGQGFWLSSAAGGDLVFDKQY